MPARRYRDWWAASSRPVAIADQQPAWVRDTRGCLVMGLDMQILESLPKQFDPPQTLLYVYDWREAGYDRDYPDYARIRPQLDAVHAACPRARLPRHAARELFWR